MWQGGKSDKGGYGKISEGPQGGKTLIAHRVSWEINKGDIPLGLFVLHKCDTPACVRPSHLFLGTATDNMDDKVAKDRQARGARTAPKKPTHGASHHNAKLNEDDIEQIRLLRADGLSQQAIADRLGVHQTAISRVLCGILWKHV